MRSSDTEKPPPGSAGLFEDRGLPYAGQSYLARLGILYMDQIRLTILAELYTREMGVRQFYETVGGTSYDSVRRHFLKLVDYGWLRKVRTAAVGGRGRPEALYRSTEQAVIDTETWGTIPLSIRDAFTVQLLEEMAGRLGEAPGQAAADAGSDEIAVFRTIEVDEDGWCEANDAIERCFRTIMQEQTDAKIRLDRGSDRPLLMVVNLAAFEATGPVAGGIGPLPKADERSSPPPWPVRVGKVFADRLDLEIVDELNRGTMTPTELNAALGGPGTTSQTFLRRCRRLADLGWAVNADMESGGPLHGASVYRFRAAVPNVSESDIYDRIPAAAREGRGWAAFRPFVETSIDAIHAGTFNSRIDRHLTMSPLLVDAIGWQQVAQTLRDFEDALDRVVAEIADRRRSKRTGDFRAAFLLSCFQAPRREIRQ